LQIKTSFGFQEILNQGPLIGLRLPLSLKPQFGQWLDQSIVGLVLAVFIQITNVELSGRKGSFEKPCYLEKSWRI